MDEKTVPRSANSCNNKNHHLHSTYCVICLFISSLYIYLIYTQNMDGINEINKYLLSAYRVPGPVLYAGEPSGEPKGQVSTFRACIVEREVTFLK